MSIRTYFGTPIVLSKHFIRQSRFMDKILTRNVPKKKTKSLSVVSPTLFPEKSGKPIINNRRVAVLNKLFMKYITDIMTTGNIEPNIIDNGVEITKIAVTPDFQNINVFWYSPLLNSDQNIDNQFNVVAHQIHHELSQLRLMGYVPKITFIRDKKKSKLEEVENLLTTVSMLKRNEEEEDVDDIPGELTSSNIPEMVSNVYGLDHDKIMKKIIIAKGKRINDGKSKKNDSTIFSCDP